MSKPSIVTTTHCESINFSHRLKLLLVASKRRHNETFNIGFVADVLKDEYSFDMSAKDAFHHCLRALEEAIAYKQFELPYRNDPIFLIEEIFHSPVTGCNKKWKNGLHMFPALDDTITLEEYYNSLISKILRYFTLTRVDWCRDVLPELKT
jgi:hypothetical protein